MAALIRPDVSVHLSFVEAMDEFAAEGRGLAADDSMIGRDLREHGLSWREPDGFAAYVGLVLADAEEEAPRPVGFVPSTTLWWVEGDAYLGRIAVRHRLTPWLLDVGGHIGYDVRPTARRRGHATAMLRAAMPLTRALGIDPVLITCDEDNVGSRRVIEANGGALEDVRPVAGSPSTPAKRRYWVPTSA